MRLQLRERQLPKLKIATAPQNGVASRFRPVSLTEMSVDPRFQRPVETARVRKIVAEFDERLLGALTLSERANGDKVILDGQHRWYALVDLGWQQVECEVFTGLSLQEEAHIFAERNKQRRTPHPLSIFRARVVAGAEPFASIDRVVRRAGYSVAATPGRGAKKFNAPTSLLAAHEWGMLPSSLFVLSELWPDQEDATLGEVITGVAAFLKNWPDVKPNALVERMKARRLAGSGLSRVHTDALGKYKVSRDRRVWAHFAKALQEHYNIQLRSGRLPDREISKKATHLWRVEP